METLLDGIREAVAGLAETFFPKSRQAAVAVIPRTPPIPVRRAAGRDTAGIYRPVKR